MTFNAIKLGLACAMTASVLWVVCSLLVMGIPLLMLSISGDMMHMQLTDMGWHLTFAGAVKGLFAWSIAAGAAGWLLAQFYNRL